MLQAVWLLRQWVTRCGAICQTTCFCFNISSVNPSLKQLNVALAACGVGGHDLAITVRRCTHLDLHSSIARLALDTSEPPCVWTLPQDLPLQQFRVCFWDGIGQRYVPITSHLEGAAFVFKYFLDGTSPKLEGGS